MLPLAEYLAALHRDGYRHCRARFAPDLDIPNACRTRLDSTLTSSPFPLAQDAVARPCRICECPVMRQLLRSGPAALTGGPRRILLLGGALLAAGAAAGGVIWSQSAGAGGVHEPAALALRGVMRSQSVRTLDAEANRSAVRGPELSVRRGGSNGKSATIGGGDEIIAALTGSLTPIAVQSGDEGTIVYSAWRQIANPQRSNPQRGQGQGVKVGDPVGIPSVRLYEEATGRDKLIKSGAHSPALSLDGRLAFVEGDTNVVRQNVDYTGKIVVGSADGTSFEPWTSESARYFPYGWAGSSLLAYKALPESEAVDLHAFTGAGQSHLLAPDAFLIAISPDGTRVLATVGRRMIEVIRVKDGAIEASMPLEDSADSGGDSTTPHALMYAGSWYGDRAVATSDVGLVVLNVRDGLRIESIIQTPTFPTGITEPTLIDDSHIVGWADLGAPAGPDDTDEPAYDNALVQCDLAATSCDVGSASPGRNWTRWVTNPSR